MKGGVQCTQHALNGMVRKCRTEGCGKRSSFRVASTKTVEYCKQYPPDGLVNVKNRFCKTEGCGKYAAFGVAGTKTAKYCRQHALGGKCAELKAAASMRRSEWQIRKRGSTANSTHRMGWSTSKGECAEPKPVASLRGSEWQVRKRRSTVNSTERMGWSTSRT